MIEAVALDEEDAVDVDLSPWTTTLSSLSIKGGLVGGGCSSEPLLLSRTTTSDIVGLKPGEV